MFKPGDIVHVNRTVSVQFVHPIAFRITGIGRESTQAPRWFWLHGYQLDDVTGEAVEKRELYLDFDALVAAQLDGPPVFLRPRRVKQPVV